MTTPSSIRTPDRAASASTHAPGLDGRTSWTFLAEAMRDLRTTGAVAPSGRALARALTAPVTAAGDGPLTVLEAGAGTGSVTRALVARLPPYSRVDVVEANSRFARGLRQLARTDWSSPAGTAAVRVHEARVEQWETTHRYDAIVSGLPFANLPPGQVEAIMRRYLDLLRPGGSLTYFAYRGVRAMRGLAGSRREAHRHCAVTEVLAGYQRRYAVGCRTVWPNVPPARVWCLRRPSAGARVPGPRRAGADG